MLSFDSDAADDADFGANVKARLKLGEHEMRLHLLSVWREAQIYTARERAALACTEAVTEFRDGDVPDAVYEIAEAQSPEAQIVALTYAVGAINGWNRPCCVSGLYEDT